MYHHRQLAFASGAVLQAVNGCAAHHWGQLYIFEGKDGLGFEAFTPLFTTFHAGTPDGEQLSQETLSHCA